MSNQQSLHELVAHTHLLTARQREQSSIGQVGPLLCIHAEGMRDGEPVALDRFFAGGCSANAALLAIRNYGPEDDHLLFLMEAEQERLDAYERVGFRTVEMQWLMSHSGPPPHLPATLDPAMRIQRATSPADALLLSAIPGMEPVQHGDLREPTLRHYYCTIHNEPIAYGRSAHYDETTIWISHLYTAPAFRRSGIGMALMGRLLADAAEMGVEQTFLLSTAMARRLYLRLGFTAIGPVALMRLSSAQLRRRLARR